MNIRKDDLKGSRERQQKTSKEGLGIDTRMEAEGKEPSIPMAPARRHPVQRDANNLMNHRIPNGTYGGVRGRQIN